MTAPKRVVRRPKRNSDTDRWMEFVWGCGSTGLAILQCVYPGEKQRHDSGQFHWPTDRREIEQYIVAHNAHGNVHASLLLRNERATDVETDAACLPGKLCWADVDKPTNSKEIRERLDGIEPVIVASGGTDHYHVYVRLQQEHTPDEIRDGNIALKDALGGDSAQQPSKLFGVPGTNHYYVDDQDPPRVRFVNGPPDVAQGVPLEDVLALGQRPKEAAPPPTDQPSEPPRSRDDLPAYLQAVISEPPGDKRGGQTYRTVAALMEYGLTDEDIVAVASTAVAAEDKYGYRAEGEVQRVVDKLRPEHEHADQTCASGQCPNKPDWMNSDYVERSWEPAWDLSDFLSRSLETDWLVDGLIRHPTHGTIAAPPKCLKTWMALDLAISVATGEDFLDHYRVPERGTVLLYINEGSDVALKERFERLLAMKGLESAPVRVRTNTVGFDSPAFLKMLRADLHLYRPRLVILDALYAFHGAKTDPSNLMAEGSLLRSMQQPCTAAGASLLVVNHFAKSARGKPQLASITQSGSGEWSDSWLLAAKSNHTNEDVILNITIGGRSTGEAQFTLRGRGAMLSEPDSPFEWEVATEVWNLEESIVELLTKHPDGLNKTQVREKVRGGNNKIDNALKSLLKQGDLHMDGRNFVVSPDE